MLAGRRSFSGAQGTESGRALLAERRRRGGQPGERWGFGGALPEAGQEGTGGAALSRRARSRLSTVTQGCLRPHAPAEDRCHHVPAIVVSPMS